MNDPLIVAGVISLMGIISAAIIAGIFAVVRFKTDPVHPLTNGLLAALQSQTKALGDLTQLLRESHVEDSRSHKEMCDGMTVLLERTRKNPE